ncbi:uncharacterized protein BO80DRAFT_256217 [Aspergillus ibericus CBS 121593]|uniref:Uncharacterized protein n=1 Tax=Aspergillus ibericus CBS 121593 TaxID=1448316 RepID=A0A395HAC3_9EURO|nr:hypothetical protein BO80DRAFT_256217 [Aspergillus ibericus CBS 121593]RAL04105.1 hypothetical protein BO80DRAFT_256217 [Aspergillus ibericus CBS 121593]
MISIRVITGSILSQPDPSRNPIHRTRHTHPSFQSINPNPQGPGTDKDAALTSPIPNADPSLLSTLEFLTIHSVLD